MSASSSDARLKTGLALAFAGVALAAFLFFHLQNSGMLPGGLVAPTKIAWLACTILFWYVLPVLLLLDHRMLRTARFACKVLLVNMIVRATIELYLMYATVSWHPWLGIAHDIFSLALMLFVLRGCWSESTRVYCGFLLVASLMYIPEALFAGYMLRNVTSTGSRTYFVPDDPSHQGIMLATAVCIILLLGYLILFSRSWLNGKAER